MAALSDFPEAPPGGLPDIHNLESDALACLWVLEVSKTELDASWMTPGELEVVLRDRYGIAIPRQRIPGLLAESKGSTTRKRIQGKWSYQVMKPGSDLLRSQGETVTFVDPNAALSHIRRVEELLRGLKGTVRVCDAYVDGRTLDFLAECTGAASIHLLTANVQKPGPFRRDLRAFGQQQTSSLEVRVAPAGQLHDRYIIDDDGLLIVGTSLNSFGRKQSFVIQAGADIRASVLKSFTALWNNSAKFQ